MPILGSAASTATGLDAMLPDQPDTYGYVFSLNRYDQLRACLAQGLGQALGTGVLAGGVVVAGTGLQVVIPEGTVYFAGGMAWLVDADLPFDDLLDGTHVTNTLWASLQRTAADPANHNALDTYALALAATLTDSPPVTGTFDWTRLAYVPVHAGALELTIDNDPPGKFAWGAAARQGLGTPLITVGAEASNVIQVTLQLRGLQHDSQAYRGAVLVWLADSAQAAETATAPSGSWVAGVGYKLADEVTDKRAWFVAGTGGSIRIDITHSGAHTYYLHALVDGIVYTKVVTFT